MVSLITLFFTALGAATLLPIQSEILLAGLAYQGELSFFLLWLVATLGNVLGACINWYLGLNLNRFAHKRWFPVSTTALDRFTPFYQRYGKWSLLLAWTPFIGDPLTFIAGIFRTSLWWFVPIVTLGKGARYAVLLVGVYYSLR